jgi:hypothetical protein
MNHFGGNRNIDLLFQNMIVLATSIQNTTNNIRWSQSPVSRGRIDVKDCDPRVSRELSFAEREVVSIFQMADATDTTYLNLDTGYHYLYFLLHKFLPK